MKAQKFEEKFKALKVDDEGFKLGLNELLAKSSYRITGRDNGSWDATVELMFSDGTKVRLDNPAQGAFSAQVTLL